MRLLGQDQGEEGSEVGRMCGFRATEVELSQFCQGLHEFTVDHVTSILRQSVAGTLQNNMRKRFESSFMQVSNPNPNPRY